MQNRNKLNMQREIAEMEAIMTFYQELQLSSVGSKQLIKSTKDKKEKLRHILIYNFKVYLVMVFCVAVVTLFTKITGSDNSVVGVTVLLAVLVLRQADFGIKTTHGLISIAGIFFILMVGPRFTNCTDTGICGKCNLHIIANDFRMSQCYNV